MYRRPYGKTCDARIAAASFGKQIWNELDTEALEIATKTKFFGANALDYNTIAHNLCDSKTYFSQCPGVIPFWLNYQYQRMNSTGLASDERQEADSPLSGLVGRSRAYVGVDTVVPFETTDYIDILRQINHDGILVSTRDA